MKAAWKKKIKIIVPPIVTVSAILLTSAVIIAYGRGYRLGKTGTDAQMLKSTGLLSTTSDPVGAQVFVDGVLRTATNNSVSVDPGVHTIKIAKDGFLPWQKTISIEKEVVSRADPFLFPVNPSLSALTSSGITKPTLSPDGTKIVYLVPPKDATRSATIEKNAGLWIYDLVDRPLGFNRDPRQIATWNPIFTIDAFVMRWSPDSQNVLVDSPKETRLYNVDKTDDLTIVTDKLDTLLNDWQDKIKIKQKQQLSSFKQPIIDIATQSARIIAFSPDETKFIYEATASATLPKVIKPALIGTDSTPETRTIEPNKLYVYDSKEDKNYFLFEDKELLSITPTPTPVNKKIVNQKLAFTSIIPATDVSTFPIRWFPTNRHIVVTLPGKIDILEYDRTNWITVYAGPFLDGFVAPWPGGSRLIIVTNLNPQASPLPNLYTANLR